MTKKKYKNAPAKSQPPKKTSTPAANPLFINHPFVVAAILIVTIACFVFKDYLFGDKVYLFKDIGSDTLNALYPGFCLYHDYLKEFGFPGWSFAFGIGQNLLPFFLRDPFDIFLYYSSRDHIAGLIAWREFFKVIGGGFIFFTYLRMVVRDGFAAIAGSIMFSFCSFMILAGGWYIFSFEAFNAALLLLAFEKLFQKNQWWLFPIPIALLGISQPFNLYIYGFFLLTYSLLRFYEAGSGSSVKSLALLLGKMTLLASIGVLISAVFFVPNVIQLFESPRGSGLSSFTGSLRSVPVFSLASGLEFKTSASRFFSGDLMGTANDFKGWYNYLEAPEFYCGILALVALPAGMANADRRRRISYLIFLVAWLLPAFFPYLRHAFWLFTGDYYRGYSFCVSIALIYSASRSLSILNTESAKVNVAIPGLSAIILLIAVSATTPEDMRSQPIFFLSVFLILFYSLFIIFLRSPNNKQMAQYALLALLAFELSYMGNTTTSKRQTVKKNELNDKTGYNDYSNEAVAFLKKSDTSFFRIDKNYASSPAMHFSLNDGMVQRYYGTSQYNSFNQINYVKALNTMQVIDARQEAQSRWLDGTKNHPLLENLFSVKYLLRTDILDRHWSFQYDSIARFGNISVLKNKFSLPLGFANDYFMLESDFKKVGKNFADVALLQAFLIPDSAERSFSALKKISSIDTAGFTVDVYTALVDRLKKDTLHLSSFSQTRLEGRITLNHAQLLFFSIPYDKGWSATVNGMPHNLAVVNGGLMGLLLPKGESTVTLTFHNRYFTQTIAATLAGCLVYLLLLAMEYFLKRRQRPSS